MSDAEKGGTPPAAAAPLSPGEQETRTALEGEGFGPRALDEFRGIAPEVVRAAITRCNEAHKGEGAKWRRSRRRKYIAALLRGDFVVEAEGDARELSATRSRADELAALKAKKDAERREREQTETEAAQRATDALLEAIRAAPLDNLTVALDCVAAANKIAARILKRQRDAGIHDRDIARMTVFRAAVVELLNTPPHTTTGAA